jgi:hypothetical protein
MSLSFNVDAGPLSQVGLELVSLSTLVQLATGAYGWFKGPERSRSLNHLLSSGGGELVSTSTFDFKSYKDLRKNYGTMVGVVVQDKAVSKVTLPKASTAVPDHAGLACLRALTTGLLCLFSVDGTVAALQNVVPFNLVQLHQEDKPFEIEGPLLVGLKQWVTAVATEEDNQPLRTQLLNKVSIRQKHLTGISTAEMFQRDSVDISDLNCVIGCLRWILLPLHKRPTDHYFTRSLKVWMAALVLGELGFRVSAAMAAVQDCMTYEKINAASLGFGDTPRVFLTVTNSGNTDPMSINEVPFVDHLTLRPQPITIRSIPWLIFRRLGQRSNHVNTQYLADVWNYSYRAAHDLVAKVVVGKDYKVQITLKAPSSHEIIPEYYRSLLTPFSPHIYAICGSAMKQFIQVSHRTKDWQSAGIMERIRVLGTEEDAEDETRDNCYTLLAIVWASLYGVCSHACLRDNHAFNEDSELAIAPDLLYQGYGKICQLSRDVGFALSTGINYYEWSDTIFSLFLSTTANQPLNMSTESSRLNHNANRLILGAQANGFTIVSDFIVKPTIDLSAIGVFHVTSGQILSYPLTEEGFIQASHYLTKPSVLGVDPEPQIESLHYFDHPGFSESMRLDVEPCWEDDPRTIVFRLREMGNVVAPLNIELILDRLACKTVNCSCNHRTFQVTVPLAERWQHISLFQLKRNTHFKGLSMLRADVEHCRSLIDASDSDLATLYALGILHSENLAVVTTCLACAYQEVQKRTAHNSYIFQAATIVIQSRRGDEKV